MTVKSSGDPQHDTQHEISELRESIADLRAELSRLQSANQPQSEPETPEPKSTAMQRVKGWFRR